MLIIWHNALMEKELLMKTGNKTCRFRMTKDICKVSFFRRYLKTNNFFITNVFIRNQAKVALKIWDIWTSSVFWTLKALNWNLRNLFSVFLVILNLKNFNYRRIKNYETGLLRPSLSFSLKVFCLRRFDTIAVRIVLRNFS